MAIEYRRPEPDEVPDFTRVFRTAMNFKTDITDDELQMERDLVDTDRSWVAVEDGRIVATTTGADMRITVPGGTVPLAGLTDVAVLPSHRRRGVMRELTSRFFADCAEHGAMAAGLFASDAAIYGRLGFGAATTMAAVHLDVRDAAALLASPNVGTIRWQAANDSLDECRAVFERSLPTRVGEIARSDAYWQVRMHYLGKADSAVWAAIHQTDGVDDGYVVYRIESKWHEHTGQNIVHILELVGEGAARIDLWRFLAGLDLVQTVRDHNARTDEPVRHVLDDPRRLRTTGLNDQLWLRVLDVPGLLGARSMAHDGTVVVAIEDHHAAGSNGRWRIEALDGKVAVEETEEAAGVQLTARGLATIVLGNTSVTELMGSKFVQVIDRAAAAELSSMLHVDTAPHTLTIF